MELFPQPLGPLMALDLSFIKTAGEMLPHRERLSVITVCHVLKFQDHMIFVVLYFCTHLNPFSTPVFASAAVITFTMIVVSTMALKNRTITTPAATAVP